MATINRGLTFCVLLILCELTEGVEDNIWKKRDEVTGGWSKLHNEEFHNLYSSPCMIRMSKSWRISWTGYVAPWRREVCI
jgi:hypothetical protein